MKIRKTNSFDLKCNTVISLRDGQRNFLEASEFILKAISFTNTF